MYPANFYFLLLNLLIVFLFFFFQAENGIRDAQGSRWLGDVYKRQNMGSQLLIMCFVVVVIGGIGSVRGAFISALLVGLVDTFGKVLLPSMSGMLVYMLMAAVLLWKPEGLFKY